MGTLAGNLAIKHQNKDFPSDIFIVFEALDVQVVVQSSKSEERTMSISDYLNGSMEKKIIKSFVLKAYPSKSYIFDSYKVTFDLNIFDTNIQYKYFADYAKSTKRTRVCKCRFSFPH